jgi:hypothetical protein
MKKLIVLITIALLSQTMIAQADSAAPAPAVIATTTGKHSAVVPPPAVTAAFATRFPNTQVKQWMERKEGYIAAFRLDHKKSFAYYAADGTWKATETPVNWTWHLPAAVHKGWLNSDYAAWYVEKITKIVTPEQTLYTLLVNNTPLLDADHVWVDKEKYVLFFSEKGELVRKDGQ